jgi:hypothetical protein
MYNNYTEIAEDMHSCNGFEMVCTAHGFSQLEVATLNGHGKWNYRAEKWCNALYHDLKHVVCGN